MRVNSPGAGAAGGAGAGAEGAADGNGTGSAENSDEGEGAAGAAVGTGAGGAGADPASGFLPNAASRSSSSRDEELGTVPKIPVALEVAPGGDPPPGESDWGDCGLPKPSLNAFMGSTICAKKLRCSGIQDYIALA